MGKLVEMVTLQEEEKLTSDQLDVFRRAFKELDLDGSGAVNAAEFKACCDSLGMPLTTKEAELMVKEVDLDGSGEIEIEEFIHAMKSKYRDDEAPEIMRLAFDV